MPTHDNGMPLSFCENQFVKIEEKLDEHSESLTEIKMMQQKHDQTLYGAQGTNGVSGDVKTIKRLLWIAIGILVGLGFLDLFHIPHIVP